MDDGTRGKARPSVDLRERLRELPLFCPASREPLRWGDGELVGGAGPYPLIGDVPDFLRDGTAQTGIHTDYVVHRRPREGRIRRTHGPIVQAFEDECFALAERETGRPLDVLDVGCGSSKFVLLPDGQPKASLALFLRHARSYVGIDPSWAMLEVATAPGSGLDMLPNGVVLRAVAEAIPLADESRDLVLAKSTLDHCADATRAFAECHRVLRPGGFLLITLQNFSSWQRRALRLVLPRRYREHRARDHHTSPFDPALLRRRLTSAGFGIERLEELGYLHVSRYKLAWLENTLFALPHALDGDQGAIAWARRLDRTLGRVAPGYGASMLCLARPRERASR